MQSFEIYIYKIMTMLKWHIGNIKNIACDNQVTIIIAKKIADIDQVTLTVVKSFKIYVYKIT